LVSPLGRRSDGGFAISRRLKSFFLDNRKAGVDPTPKLGRGIVTLMGIRWIHESWKRYNFLEYK